MLKSFCKKLSHLDLSGIKDLPPNDLLKLLNELSLNKLCGNLIAVHLSDLDINFNVNLKDEIHDLFNIKAKDNNCFTMKGGLFMAVKHYVSLTRGNKHQLNRANEIGYVDVIKKATNQNSKGKNLLLGLNM